MVCVTLYNRRIQTMFGGAEPTLRLPGWKQKSTGMLLQNLIREMGTAVNLLHIIQCLRRIDPLPHLPRQCSIGPRLAQPAHALRFEVPITQKLSHLPRHHWRHQHREVRHRQHQVGVRAGHRRLLHRHAAVVRHRQPRDPAPETD